MTGIRLMNLYECCIDTTCSFVHNSLLDCLIEDLRHQLRWGEVVVGAMSLVSAVCRARVQERLQVSGACVDKKYNTR